MKSFPQLLRIFSSEIKRSANWARSITEQSVRVSLLLVDLLLIVIKRIEATLILMKS